MTPATRLGAEPLNRTVRTAAVVAALALIVGATLLPQSGSSVMPGFFCLTCDELWGVDVILNMMLFAPLGIALYWMGSSRLRIAFISFGLSSVIEFLQWSVVPGRDPSVRDIIANGMGGVIAGWTALAIAELRREGRPVQYARGLAVMLFLWIAQALVTGWAVAPEPPQERPYYGQWAHLFPGTVPLGGKVLRAVLDGVPVPDDSLAGTDMVRGRIETMGVALDVSVDSLRPAAGEAQIFGLVTGPIRIIGLDLLPRGLRFQSRAHSARLGLMRPGMILPVPEADGHGDLFIRAVHLRDRLTLEVLAGGEMIRSGRWTLSAAQGWALIVPRRPPASQIPWWTLCWIAVFSLPAGLLAWGNGPTGLSAPRVLPVMVAMLMPLQLAAVIFHCAPPTLLEVLGVVGGCLAGIPAAQLVSRQRNGTSATKRS